MKVLVAGATGALGVPLTRLLVSAGHQVIGLTRTPVNGARLVELGARPVVADAMDSGGLLTALRDVRADAVVHALTALKTPPARRRDMTGTDLLREQGTANLLAAARQVGASRFVAESMHFGYGFGDWAPRCSPRPAVGTARAYRGAGTAPGRVPLVGEAGLRRHGAGLDRGDLAAVRHVLGPGAGLETFVDMLRRRRMPLPGGGRRVLSWVHIDDAATAIPAALERGRPGQAYNVVDDEPVALADVFDTLADAFGTPRPRSVPVWMVRMAAPCAATFLGETTLRASADRAKAELDRAPSVPTYREGVSRAAREQRAVTP